MISTRYIFSPRQGCFKAARFRLLCGTAIFLTVLGAAVPASADYAAGLRAFSAEDYKSALGEWQSAAQAGDAQAQHGLGLLYEMGKVSGRPDIKSAIRWYEAASAQGLAAARNNLARLYAEGNGVEKNQKRAIALWTAAAESGNTTALFNLGIQYANANGVAKDEQKAADLIGRAAEGNLSEAQFVMGEFYREGIGVSKDSQRAYDWYRRAADNGNMAARAQLTRFPDLKPTETAMVSPANSAGQPVGTADVEAAATASVAKTTEQDPAAAPLAEVADGPAKDAAQSAPSQPAAPTSVLSAAKANVESKDTSGASPASPTTGADQAQAADEAHANADKAASTDQAPGAASGTADQSKAKTPSESLNGKKASDEQPGSVPAPSIEADAGTMEKSAAKPATQDAAEALPAATAKAGDQPDTGAAPKAESDASKAVPSSGTPQPAPKEMTTTADQKNAAKADAAATTDKVSKIPVAESLNGDKRIYRIWLASKSEEGSARSEWDRLLQKYPNILKPLTPDYREYYFNSERGAVYRLFAGPFSSLDAAQKACADIQQRYSEEFCRTVIN